MATTATLTVNAEDIIGADFDKSRASVWVEANTDNGLIVVDGTTVRVGGRRENLVDGVATFELVTTDSADNPESFGYRVTIVYVPKGSRKQGHDTITTSDFPFTVDANLAAIPEAWDNVTAPVSWRSEIVTQVEAKAAQVEADRAYVEGIVITDLGTTDGQASALIDTDGSLTRDALLASLDHSGAVHADTQPGATVANKINAAATAAPAVSGVVVVPTTLSGANGTYQPSDLGIPAQRTVVDYRNEKGTISNANQRGSVQMSRVFAANVASVATGSDNGSVLALDAILTGGTGGNGASGTTVHGENCALYAGTMRAAESSRSAWGANVLLTTYAAPTATMQTIGFEVNVGNNSGVNATASTVLDGIAVISTGNADLRYGVSVGTTASTPAVTYLDGIHIYGNNSRAAINIDAPIGGAAGNASVLGILCAAPAQFATKVAVTGSTATAPQVRAEGTDDHIDLTIGGKNNGKLNLLGSTGADPATTQGWFDAKINGTAVRIPFKIVP